MRRIKSNQMDGAAQVVPSAGEQREEVEVELELEVEAEKRVGMG